MSRNTTLGEIANIITGPFGSQLHMSDYVDIGVPVIMPQDIVDRTVSMDNISYIGENNYLRLIRYAVKPNDIIFARRGDIEKHAFITDDSQLLCGTGCFRVRITDSTVYPLFLSYYLDRLETRKWLVAHAVGTNMPNLNTAILASVPVELPDFTDQVKIGDFLYNMEKKIQYNKKIIDNLQHQLKLIYDYWFTQFDFPDKNGKPYRSSGGAMIWNEQLKRNIPQNWIIGAVSDCVEKISTGLNPRDNFVLGNGNIRYITVKNLTATGSLDFSGCDMIDEEARTIVHRRSDIDIGDILFASIAPLGRCFLIQQEPVDWDINESVFSIRSKLSAITPEYLYLYFQSDSFIRKATYTSTGSIFKGIRINTLLDTTMVIPELQVCKDFSNVIKSLLAEINNNSAETERLLALRDWLLPMLMNGQASIVDEREEKPQIKISRFEQWLANQGFAARGGVDMDVLRDIYEAMDDDDK